MGSQHVSRRGFLQGAATGGILAGIGDLAFLSQIPAVRADESSLDPDVVQLDPTLILAAIDLHRLEKISFRDALIVRAAASGGCVELLTEDLQAGRRIAGVRVVDPFRP